MPIVKRHTLWTILEGIRLWNGYKGDGDNDSIGLPTPTWKDINGNSYTHIYAGKYGKYDNGYGHNQIIYHENPTEENRYYPEIHGLLINNFSAIDEETNVYVTNDVIENWSATDYQVNNIVTISYERGFNVMDNTYGKRTFNILLKNETQSDKTVTCFKFTKIVGAFDPTVQHAEEEEGVNDAIIEAEALYISYFLDEPLLLRPNEERMLVIAFTPLMDSHPDFKKTQFWVSVESIRLANFNPATQDNAYGTQYNNLDFLSYYSYEKDGITYATDTYSGYYGIIMKMYGKRYDDTHTIPGGIRGRQGLDLINRNCYPQLPVVGGNRDAELTMRFMGSFDKYAIIRPITMPIEEWEEWDWNIPAQDQIPNYDIDSHFIYNNGVYSRKFKVKSYNSSNEQISLTGFAFYKTLMHGFSPSAYPSYENAERYYRDHIDVRYQRTTYFCSEPSSTGKFNLYGIYFFSTPIPIPPGEFRTVTLTVTPEDISIDVIIDDDEEEEEGEG